MSRSTTEWPPRDIPASAHPVPPMWNSGMATIDTVSASMRKASTAPDRMVAMLSPEIMTPFGSPVVPEV